MPQRSLSRPSSRHELALDDEELLGDSAAGLATPSSTTRPQGPTLTLDGLTEPLPPLNLATAIAYSSARAKVIPQASQQSQQSQSQQSQHPQQLQHQSHSSSFSFQPAQRPHKSSFSVPPSSRAVNTFSVVDSSEDADTLHARSANYETLLRQFSLRRQSSQRLHTYQAPVAAVSASRPSRLQRVGSAEDLRNSLTRLGSSLTLDRIRRRSNEGSSIATSAATAVYEADGGSSSTSAPASSPKRRLSLARSVRRLKLRVAFQLRSLLEPLTPQSHASLLRHVAVVLLLLVQLAYLPFAPTFLADFHVGLLIQLNIVLEIVWLLDLGLQFNTAIIVDDAKTQGGRLLVTTRSLIAQAYLQRAFLLDALAALPLETVASLTRSSSSTALVQSHPTLYYIGSSLRLLKFRLVPASLRALQHSPLGQWLTRVKYRQAYVSVVTVAVEILFMLVIAVHYLACAWYVVMPPAVLTVFPDDLWATYVHTLVDVSLLFSGDGIVAIHTMETDARISLHVRLFLLFMMLLGVVLSAFAFARLSVVLLLDTLVQQERDGSYHLERSLASLTTRMAKLRLPEALQDRVKLYFTHLSREYGVVDGRDSSLYHFSQSSNNSHSSMLSAPLALEVALCRYTATMGRMGLWKGCSADLMSALIVRVEPRVYLKDDFVRRKGEIGTELVIVQRGTCEYMAPHSQGLHDDRRTGASGRSSPLKSSSQQRLLTVGASLGQLALIVDYKFPVYVRAVSHIEVGIVRREVFQELVNRFVDDRERLVRRIFRTGLEGAELPALWQLVNRYCSPPAGGTNAAATASFASATTTSSGGVPVATRTTTPLVRQATNSGASDRRISTREAAKTLVRVLEISTMPRHVRLSLPLVLEPEAVRDCGGLRQQGTHRTLSVSTRSGTAPLHRTQSSDPSCVHPAVSAAVSAVSAAAAAAVSAAPAPASAAAATTAPTPNEAEAEKTPEVSARAESQAFLDEMALTQSALLSLVQNLTEAVTRLDLKVSRMEERVNRTEDTARYVAPTNNQYGLFRRRSSRMDSEDHGVLIRRRSSFNGSEGYDRERDSSSYDWHVPRMLPPDELAVLRANAAAAALGHKVDDSESRPASSAFTDRQTRFQSSRVSSHVSEVPQSTFDEEALTLRGVNMLGQLTSRSTPPSSARLGSFQSTQPAGPRVRSRSFTTTTRQRLNSFQTSLQQAITGTATATATATSTATGTATAGTATEPTETKRRASLSTMWTRAKPTTSDNGGGGLS